MEPNDSLALLAGEKCAPAKAGTPPLKGAALEDFENRLGNGWKTAEEHQLEKEFAFKDFAQALAFTNQVGALAEAEDHHPEIYLTWGKVKVTLWTHSVGGLSRNDFVLAAKIERTKRPG